MTTDVMNAIQWYVRNAVRFVKSKPSFMMREPSSVKSKSKRKNRGKLNRIAKEQTIEVDIIVKLKLMMFLACRGLQIAKYLDPAIVTISHVLEKRKVFLSAEKL